MNYTNRIYTLLLCLLFMAITWVQAQPMPSDEFYHTPRGTYAERKKQSLDYCVKYGERGQRIGIFTQIARLLSGLRTEDAYVQDAIQKIRSNWDCNDFSLNGLLRMAYMEKEKPQLSPAMAQKVEACILDFKYWWDDARRDTTYRCYHTENHQALYHTAELLAGQLYKDRTFTSGLTGAGHVSHAEKLLLSWLDYRFRFGFSEWLSSYYEVEILLLANLYDYAENPVIKERARMVLDLLMFDLALGNFHGMLSTTSGRIYAHSLVTGHHSLSPTLKLVFGEGIYIPDAIMSNVALCGSTYRCPQVILDIATDYSKPMLNRQKVSIEVDDAEKYGLTFEKEEDTNIFWGMQEFIHPKVVLMSKQVSEKYGVYPYRNYNDYIRRYDKQVEEFGKIVNNRLDRFALSESNLETYRTNEYMMSCSFDYRKGVIAYQQHIWQATLDNQASVFTTHPGRKGLGGSPNYWGGSAVLPRAVQHKNVVICIYNIPEKEGMSLTHAYFPKADFDEVEEANGWVFGRKGNGYVALYSQHPAAWQANEDGEVNDYAVSGRQNSWICEVGSVVEWGSFRKFIDAISRATVSCKDLNVVYVSPVVGKMEFGWETPFLLQGKVMPLKTEYRYDNPYCQARFDIRQLSIRKGKRMLRLNWETLARTEK